ncbi:hypothetical protein CLV47_10910 [Antricoccus suffuscus]|uniref:Probable membrane transporter protein n=1 Tax=Antricoccus suffuscus TaxID=1629062 RepID=A0A2T0ZYQ4_9ACTN|nr:sulfite exporter TauE/SafE family protein [Antricoccus suffuscus]PRZ41463.1 hypothetical protein CLV47_10910 [Antricoccus suffuscus]
MTALLITSFCVAAFSAAAQALTGFGFALLGVPLLALAVDAHTAVVAITTVELALTAVIAIREWSHVQWRSVIVVTLASFVGIPIGLYVLATFDEHLLNAVIAVVVLVFAAIIAFGLTVPRGPRTEIVAGVSSGVLLASTGMNGPPLVAAFQAMGLSPRSFRATLQAAFTVQIIIVVIGFVLTDQFTGQSVTVAATAIPALVIGWFLGDKLFHRLTGPHFRRLVLGTLVVSGVLTLIRAFAG